MNEEMAGICFRELGARIDYAGFFGSDPVFRSWVEDLFTYYWTKGERS
jgi:predicted transcriptional regulator